jgi:alpha-D-ribose 1-methylphosphonate 5-triphosphate synthase subunit PhnH
MRAAVIRPAFRDAPREAQAVFRTVMEVMARPGRILPLLVDFATPAPLGATAAAILMTLADFETPVWLDDALSREQAVSEFLRFHSGARVAASPEAAVFALIADAASAPPLSAFAQGTADYPDRSTTVIWQVQTLHAEGRTFAGPGIQGEIAFEATPLPAGFPAQLAENRACYPLGVDLIFAAPYAVAALPRSTRLMEAR